MAVKNIAKAITSIFEYLKGSPARRTREALRCGDEYIRIAKPLIRKYVPKDKYKKELKYLRHYDRRRRANR